MESYFDIIPKFQNGDAKTLCVEKDGQFSLINGELSNCGPSECCILYES